MTACPYVEWLFADEAETFQPIVEEGGFGRPVRDAARRDATARYRRLGDRVWHVRLRRPGKIEARRMACAA